MTSSTVHDARQPLIKIRDLVTRFNLTGGLLGKVTSRVHAVENVSFDIFPGETLAMVGESGCGKSTVARSIMQLDRPLSGSIIYNDNEMIGASRQVLANFRREVQMVFQDPFSSLNPRMTIAQALLDPLNVHNIGVKSARRKRVAELLAKVELTEDYLERYPHAFSGGQRQRICIARALALNPKLIIADEAVASLDVTIQAQVINLLMDLQRETGVALLFISHDMAVVERIAHRVAVMYLGEIVEIGDRRSIFGNPQHPYTRKLLSTVPVADPLQRPEAREPLSDEIPSALRGLNFTHIQRPMTQISSTHFVRESA